MPVLSLLAAAALLALVAAAPAPAAKAHAGYWRHCGSDHHVQAGWYGAIVHGAGCHTARRVARRWWHHNPTSTYGFACIVHHHGAAAGRVLCRSEKGGARKVRFSYSAHSG